jgi:hypothetical protein
MADGEDWEPKTREDWLGLFTDSGKRVEEHKWNQAEQLAALKKEQETGNGDGGGDNGGGERAPKRGGFSLLGGSKNK